MAKEHMLSEQTDLQYRCCQHRQAQQQPAWNGRGSTPCIRPLSHPRSVIPKVNNYGRYNSKKENATTVGMGNLLDLQITLEPIQVKH
jgi:hypothetical protein